MNTYLQRVLANVAAKGDALFCRQVSARGDRDVSWSELGRDAARFVALYRRNGLRTGDTVLIFLRHTPSLYASFLGAMLGGLTPSFMPCTSPRQDPTVYWRSHSALMHLIRPAAIVAAADTFVEMEAAGLDFAGARKIDVDAARDLEGEAGVLASPDSVAVLQHSSGTTGLKKGVALSYSAIVNQIESYAAQLRIDGEETIVSWLPLYHDMGFIACFLTPLYLGLPAVHIDPFHWLADPGSLLRHATAHKNVLIWLPNFGFEHLANTCGRNAGAYSLGGVKAFIDCSEPCKAKTFDRFSVAFAQSGVVQAQLQCCYAMAEAVFAVTQTRIGTPVARVNVDAAALLENRLVHVPAEAAGALELIECGAPIDGVKVDILDPADRLLPAGRIGQIGLSGAFMFSGYNKDPARTQAAFAGDVYRTGDLGFFHDGHLYVLGRVDDMLIINGRNIFAHEVEACLREVEGLKAGRAIAGSIFSERNGTAALIVIAELQPGATREHVAISRDVVSVINATFSIQPYKVKLVEEGWLIKTTSGKISREANMRKFLAATGGRI